MQEAKKIIRAKAVGRQITENANKCTLPVQRPVKIIFLQTTFPCHMLFLKRPQNNGNHKL